MNLTEYRNKRLSVMTYEERYQYWLNALETDHAIAQDQAEYDAWARLAGDDVAWSIWDQP